MLEGGGTRGKEEVWKETAAAFDDAGAKYTIASVAPVPLNGPCPEQLIMLANIWRTLQQLKVFSGYQLAQENHKML